MLKRTGLVLGAMLLLSGCDEVMTYGAVHSKSPVPETMYATATEKGAIVTQLRGNPFSISDSRLSEMVRGYMRDVPFGPHARFVAASSTATVEPYKVVVAFHDSTRTVNRNECRSDAGPAEKGGTGRMIVSMSFCFGSDRISHTWGSVGNVSGPDDPKFRSLIRQTALTLIPQYWDPQDNE